MSNSAKNSRTALRTNRHRRVRARVKGTLERPRLSIFRSNSHIYAQLVDDVNGRTLLATNDQELPKEVKKATKDTQTKIGSARAVGLVIAKMAQEKKISQVVFDRGGYIYTGRVKALADGAREGGLKF